MKGKVKVQCKYWFPNEYIERGCTNREFRCGTLFRQLILTQMKAKCNSFKVDWTTYVTQKEHLIKLED